jgi:hypothetical protein
MASRDRVAGKKALAKRMVLAKKTAPARKPEAKKAAPAPKPSVTKSKSSVAKPVAPAKPIPTAGKPQIVAKAPVTAKPVVVAKPSPVSTPTAVAKSGPSTPQQTEERRKAATRKFFARLRSLEAIVGADLRKRGSLVLMQAVDQWYSEAVSATASDVSITNAAKAVIGHL